MSAPNTITTDKLARLVAMPRCPVLVDVRTAEDFAADPRLIPAAHRRTFDAVAGWSGELTGRAAVVICEKGLKLSQGVAALLRHAGIAAETLDGGFVAWRDAGLPLVPDAAIPTRDPAGRTLWVTRARPKIDRIACPWLIRRFVDPAAVILFVAPSEVIAVAERFHATPFDVEDVYWSHRGTACTFDTMVDAFALRTAPLLRLAAMVRGADTAQPGLSPEAPGLLAVSLGLSRMFTDDLEQLEAGMLVYDALYRWCRDATDETHDWPAGKVAAR